MGSASCRLLATQLVSTLNREWELLIAAADYFFTTKAAIARPKV